MTQQPFSRPGAIDLSGLKRPAAAAAGRRRPAAAGAPVPRRGRVVRTPSTITRRTSRRLLEASMTAPVLLVFYSRPGCPRAASSPTTSPTRRGRVRGPVPGRARRHRRRAGDRPGDADPVGAARGRGPRRPADAADPGRAAARRAAHRAHPGGAAAHRPGHHRPAPAALGAAPRRPSGEDDEPLVDPRYAAGPGRARRRRHRRGRVAEYQKLVDANPADAEAAAGLAMAKVLQRTQGVDLDAGPGRRGGQPRRRRRADPGRRPRHARRPRRGRLHPAGRRGRAAPSGDDRNKAREHLARPVRAPSATTTRACCAGRQNLASALF